MTELYFDPDPQLTIPDRLVFDVLHGELKQLKQKPTTAEVDSAYESDNPAPKRTQFVSPSPEDIRDLEKQTVEILKAFNNPNSATFEPSVFSSLDTSSIRSPNLRKWVIDPYISVVRRIVRYDTDVIMGTHLLLYLTTSLPSAICLYYNFNAWHGLLHCIMQGYYMGAYTLLMHQHIHMRGVLKKKFALFDTYFPYIMDPLMGHTWNSYYFHHVKHHHVEGNGPEDLSSTVRYQRDNVWDFLAYVGRFYFLGWIDLPLYFFRKGKTGLAAKFAFFELSNYLFVYLMYTRVNARVTTIVFLIPLAAMRFALMVGNWGQHAFVDEKDPTSDFRSSITLIDVASNRHCYNDGYHTSHHLNPLRHWRDHPSAFLSRKKEYADEQALVFYNIDYLMVTWCLLTKNYTRLAKSMIPLGSQVGLSLEERVEMLKRKTKKFTEEEIAEKFGKQYARFK